MRSRLADSLDANSKNKNEAQLAINDENDCEAVDLSELIVLYQVKIIVL